MLPLTLHPTPYLHNTHDSSLNGDGAILLHPLGVVALFQQGHGDANLAHGAATWWVVDRI